VPTKAAPEDRGKITRRIRPTLLRLAVIFVSATISGQAAGLEPLETWQGPPLKPFALDDSAKFRRDIADYRGQPLIVHFFATWCEPCRRELPALAVLIVRHKAARLGAVAVSVNEPDSRVRRFLDESPVPFPVLLDRNRDVAKSWAVDILPTTILFDADLMPRQIVRGEFDWGSPEADDAIRALGKPGSSPDQPLTSQGG
jgi:peroxiredoxin